MGLGQQILTFRRRVRKVLLPILLGSLGSATIVVLWQQLLLQEQLHIERLTEQYTAETVDRLNEKLIDRINALDRMKQRWEAQGGTPRALWEADAIAYNQDFYSIRAFQWVDSSMRVRWIVPLQGNEAAQNLLVNREIHRRVAFSVAQSLRQVTLTNIISLRQGGQAFLAIAPLFITPPPSSTGLSSSRDTSRNTSRDTSRDTSAVRATPIPTRRTLSQPPQPTASQQFDGFLVVVFQVPEFFTNVVQRSPDYAIRLYDGDQLIHAYLTNQDNPANGLPAVTPAATEPFIPTTTPVITTTTAIKIYGMNWRLEVTPTPRLIQRERSPLPTLILIGGLISVWLLALVIYLTQFSYQRAKGLAHANQKLQQEIQQRQTVETSLRQSQATKQAILTAIPDLLIQMKGSGEYVDFIANSSINIYQDEKPRQAVTPYDILPNDLAALRMHYTQQALTTGKMQIYEHELTFNGQSCYEEVRIVPMGEDQVLVLIRNIDERKQQEVVQQQIEQALRESEAKYRHLISNLHAGFVVHAPDTSILLCNVTACELLGLTMEQMQGKQAIDPAWHFLREDGSIMPLAEYPVNRAIATHVPLINYVLGIHHPNGLIVWVLVNAIPEFNVAGDLQQIVITFINISDRKRAEQQLQELSERFNVAIQSAQIGIWDWDIRFNHLIWDDRMYKLYGIQPENFSGAYEAWDSAMHPDDRPAVVATLQQAVREKRSFDTEFRVVWPDGTIRFIKAYGLVQHDSQGQPMRMIGVNYDISDRKQAEEALHQSEERWELALRGNNDGIWDWNIKTNEVFFSTRWKEMLGYAEHEIDNHVDEWSTRVHPDDLPGVMQLIQDHFAQKTPFYLSEHRVRCKDGSYKWILDRGQALWDAEGQLIRMTGSHTDITERKQMELELADELRRRKILFRSSFDGVVVMNQQGDVVETNVSFAQMLGYTVPEMLTLNVADWDANWTRQQLEQLLNRDEVIPLFETRHRRKDGSVFDVEVSWSRVELKGEILNFCICRDISERVRWQTALRESEEKLSSILDNVDASVVRFRMYPNRDWQYDYISSPSERLFGCSPETFKRDKQTWMSRLHPDDRDRAIATAFDTILAASTHTMEYRYCHPDGSIRWVSETLSARWHEAEQCWLVTAVRLDITDRKTAELALAESEATKQAIIAAIPDLLIRMRADGTYLEFRATPEFRVLCADLLGREINNRDALPPDLAELRMDYTQRALATGSLQIYEQEVEIDNERLYEEVRIVPIDADQVLIMVRDITQRKQAELELFDQKERIQTIVDNIPVMIALFDAQGRIQLINPELERILGWSFQAWQQQNLLLACYPDPAYRQEVLSHMLAANGTWKDVQTVNAHGEVIETSWANVRLSNGMILGIGQDIRDRKRVEQAMRQAMEVAEAANLAKSTFLANMSHELRTPLNVILGFAQVMARAPELPPNLRQDLATIQRSGDHLLALINDVLDLSKIEAGHFSLELNTVDLLNLIHSLHTMLAERAKAKQIQLILDVDLDVPQFILADSQKLRQILINLLGNAIKFTKHGSVTLKVRSLPAVQPSATEALPAHLPSAQSSTNLLQIQVIDTGVGIPVDEQELIFDAFVQTQAGRRSAQGTGLGLAISRRLVELMNGELSVQSQLGMGSTFTLTIPVSLTTASDPTNQPDNRIVVGLVPGQPHRRILVVDDQPENRLLMIKLMSQIGLDVREASNGLEAVEIWRDWRPDLTWMDIRMPILNGYEATKWIRDYEREREQDGIPPRPEDECQTDRPAIPHSIIIALTAQASRSDRSLAIEAGCNDYLSKPFQEAALLHKMADYLGLEYIYATPTAEQVEEQRIESLTSDEETVTNLTATLLRDLPADWMQQLEDVAICGDDRAIATLVNQLPPTHAPLAAQLLEWSESYQFERIIQLIQGGDG